MSGNNEKEQEDHLRDVDRVLLYLAEAGLKAEKTAETLAKAGAEERLITALRTTASAMNAEHKRLMNSTFYTVPYEQERFEVGNDDSEQEQLAYSFHAR